MTTLRSRLVFVLLSLVFFAATATTFASLGLVLPAMIAEFRWSWAEAGLGFTVLALFTGLFSPVSSATLKRLGARANYALGGLAMTAGFLLLGGADALAPYLVATALLGAGFALVANVPSVYVIARTTAPALRGRLIGAYLAAGGLGGVAGPLAASLMLTAGRDWRAFWFAAAAAVLALTIALVAALGPRAAEAGEDGAVGAAGRTAARDWTLGEAARTPAFYAVAGALFVAYLCGVSVSSFAATQMQALGLSAAASGFLMSLHAAANAGARALGGFAQRRVGARSLLVTALLAEGVGMTALAFAATPLAGAVFAVFEGYAFGMALFATTVLAIEYFGLKHSPAILGAMNLVATAAMIGPVLTGAAGDAAGGFAAIFLAYAGVSVLGVAALVLTRNPNGGA